MVREGRRRRWIRAVGWVIGGFASVVAILLLAVAAYLLFTDYPEKLRSALEQELTRLSGAPATIRAINLDIPHYAFSLEGVSVSAPGHAHPVLELERVWGKLHLAEVLNLRLQWSELVVEGLTLHLVEDPEEGLSLPARPVEAASVARVGFSADRVSIQHATLVIDNERVPWELEAENLSMGLTRTSGDHYKGMLSYDEGHLRIKENQDIRASVEADFEVEPQELLLREARVRSDVGQLLLTGKLAFAGGTHGRFDVTAEGDVSRALDSVFGIRFEDGLVRAAATFRGSLAVEPEDKTLEGTLLLPEGSVGGVPLAGWKGEIFWDRSLFQVSYAQGSVAEGSARLQLHQPLPVHEHPAALDVDFEGVSLARLLEQTRGVRSPVETLLRGRMSVSFPATEPSALRGELEIDGQSPAAAGVGVAKAEADRDRSGMPPEVTPLSLHARGTVAATGLVIDEASFETPFLKGSFSGTYPRSGPARIGVDLTSSDLEASDRMQRDLRRLATTNVDEHGNRPDLIGMAGRAEVHGIVSGTLADVSLEGDLAAESLRFASIDLGEVRSRLELARERLTLRDLSAHLRDGELSGRAGISIEGAIRDRDFDLDLTMGKWPIEGLSRVLGAPLLLEGSGSGRVVASRESSSLEGSASLALERGRIAALAYERGRARLDFRGSRIRLDPISMELGGGSAKGRLDIDLASGTVAGSATTGGLALESIAPEWASASGTLEGKLEIQGPISSPEGSLSGRARDVRLKGVDLGEAFVSGSARSDHMDLTVSLEREAAEIVAEGSLQFSDDDPARVRLRWHGIDAARWLGLVSDGDGQLTVLTDGSGTLRVPLKAPDLLTATRGDGELSELAIESESYRIATARPVRLRIEGGRVFLDEAELSEGTSRLTLGGSMDLASRALDVRADGIVSLGLLQSLYPDVSATGDTKLSAEISGTRERPSLTGYAELDGGSIRFEGFRQALGGLTGRVVFDNRTVRFPELHGVFGTGPVSISGNVGLDGLRPTTLDLSVKGTDVHLRYPEGLVATIDGELSLVGSGDEHIVSGALVLRDALWSREYDLVSGMLSDREGLGLFQDLSESDVLKGVRLDVSLRAPGTLKVRNGVANIDADAELELRGTLGHPVLLGRSEAKHGEIFFLGQRYNVTQGKVDFVDPGGVEPFVDLTAETRVRSYRVELRLTGTPQRFFPELSSDPPLRTVDILRLLAGANERDILIGTEEEELAGVGVASLLTERLTQEVGKRAERLFGLDRFSIDPFLIGQFANPTARVSLGKQITRQLSINYSTNLNATTEAIILIEYTPDGPMSWVLSRDEEGDVGLDVKFRKSF